MSRTIQDMIYVSQLHDRQVKAQNRADLHRIIEANTALFLDFREVSRYYVSAAETGSSTDVEGYYLAITEFYDRKEDIVQHFWALGASFMRSLAEMRILVSEIPSPVMFKAMQKAIDDSFDFFTFAWESDLFSDEAYERLCELNAVSQERLEEVMA